VGSYVEARSRAYYRRRLKRRVRIADSADSILALSSSRSRAALSRSFIKRTAPLGVRTRDALTFSRTLNPLTAWASGQANFGVPGGRHEFTDAQHLIDGTCDGQARGARNDADALDRTVVGLDEARR
jgi:hypothetical protein